MRSMYYAFINAGHNTDCIIYGVKHDPHVLMFGPEVLEVGGGGGGQSMHDLSMDLLETCVSDFINHRELNKWM